MTRTSRWRGRSINVLLMLASLLAVFVVLEIAARMHFRAHGRKGKEGRERTSYTIFDPTLGWRLRPNARAHYERGEYSTDVVTNSLGMRDRERPIVPSPGSFRILALGDSFVEGYTVSLDQTVAQVIEHALSGPRCPIDVINAGVGGYSTDQECLLYRASGRRLGARVVLLFFFYNDLAPLLDASYYGAPKPLFVGDRHGGLALRTEHIRESPPKPEASQPPKRGGGPRLRSAAWAWLSLRLSVGAPRLHDALARWGFWEPVDRQPVNPELKAFHLRPSADVLAAWWLADRLLAMLRREVEADGARLLVVYVPARMEVDDRAWESACIQYSLLPERWSRQAVVRRLEESGRRGGFPVLDLTPALRAANVAPFWRTYLQFDAHWNARGHRVAGEAIVAYLRGAGLVPDCALPR
jgi:hypothetical protein